MVVHIFKLKILSLLFRLLVEDQGREPRCGAGWRRDDKNHLGEDQGHRKSRCNGYRRVVSVWSYAIDLLNLCDPLKAVQNV